MNLLDGIQEPCATNLDGTAAQLFLMMINTLMSTQCLLGDKGVYPPDSTNKLQDGDQFDFIIVGAGSAGSVVTNILLKNPKWKILVLEAGEYPSATSEVPALLYNLQNTAEDWQYKTEKSNTSCKAFEGGQCRWPRGNVLGGSSSINSMIYVRGSSRNYDDWENLGNAGWGYNDLESRFKKFENVKSDLFRESGIYGKGGIYNLSWYDNGEPITKSIINGVNYISHPTRTLELDPKRPLGYYQTLMSIDQGVRVNTAKSFLGNLKNKENLLLATKSFVRRLLIDKKTLTVTGVEAQVGATVWKFYAKKEVILSAGSLNTPQILLHSGIGNKSDLEALGIEVVNDLPGVGENLQDHLSVPLYFKVDQHALAERPNGSVLDDLYNYFKARKGPMATMYMTNLNGFINTKRNSQFPNIQLLHLSYTKNDEHNFLELMSKKLGYNAEITKFLRAQINEDSIIAILPTLLNPKSTGSIKLKNKDVFQSPKFYSGYFSDEYGEDLNTLRIAIKFVFALISTAQVQQYNPRLSELPLPACDFNTNTDEYWTCYIQHVANTQYHQVGTAKMGPSNDKMAVVDESLRVHGLGKLRVIDASIMPIITSGNTNAPTLVIAHKGAEMILEDWRDGPRNRSEEL